MIFDQSPMLIVSDSPLMDTVMYSPSRAKGHGSDKAPRKQAMRMDERWLLSGPIAWLVISAHQCVSEPHGHNLLIDIPPMLRLGVTECFRPIASVHRRQRPIGPILWSRIRVLSLKLSVVAVVNYWMPHAQLTPLGRCSGRCWLSAVFVETNLDHDLISRSKYKAPSSSTPRKAQPSTLRLQGEICSWGRGKSECRCSNWIYEKRNPPTISGDGFIAPKSTARIGADARTRTPDPLFTKQPLYQLSYEGKDTSRPAGEARTGICRQTRTALASSH